VRFLGHLPDDEYGAEFRGLLATRAWCEHGGMVGREALRDEFSRAALLVLPSLEDNCPMAVLEAMAAGVPVVAAKVGGVPDLIDDGRTGLFCDPCDPASMAAAVERMLASSDTAAACAANARVAARERFAPVVVARRHVEIYRELLQTRS
jgi:glycosyltransferase involved in cell wall biosynthesis